MSASRSTQLHQLPTVAAFGLLGALGGALLGYVLSYPIAGTLSAIVYLKNTGNPGDTFTTFASLTPVMLAVVGAVTCAIAGTFRTAKRDLYRCSVRTEFIPSLRGNLFPPDNGQSETQISARWRHHWDEFWNRRSNSQVDQ